MAVFTAAEALNMALRAEQTGQAFYEAAANKAEDAQVKSLLEELAAWEQRHYETFSKLAEGAGSLPPLPNAEWGEYDQYMQAALSSAMFAGPDKALALVDTIETEQDVIRMALGFEKDALLLYYDLREMMPEKDREAVSQIIREEKSHAMRLATMLRSGGVDF
jgi:rubrerythrin